MQSVFGVTFIVLLMGATFVAAWCWGRAELQAAELRHKLDALLDVDARLALNGYQLFAMRTAKPQKPVDAMDHALFGLASEVGELCTHWKAHRYYGKPLDHDYMVKELGDTLWFLQLAATSLVVPLEDVGRKNLDKLRARYPSKFSNEAALARADEALTQGRNA